MGGGGGGGTYGGGGGGQGYSDIGYFIGGGGGGGSSLVPAGGTRSPAGSPASVTLTYSAPAAPSRVLGAGTVLQNGQTLAFGLDVSSTGTSVTGRCAVAGNRGTRIVCRTVSDYVRTGNTVTFRGTADVDGRVVAYTATLVDAANPNGARADSYTIDAGGRRYLGTLTAGNILIS